MLLLKKDGVDSLVTKVNNIYTSRFADWKNADCNAKTSKIKRKIPSISGLATKCALTAVDDKIPGISSLVKKTDYNTKISENEKKVTDHNNGKNITTPEFNTFTAEIFATRLAQANLVIKTYFDAKLITLNRQINSNKTNIYFLKTNWKSYKHLVQAILKAKVILKKKMARKII